MTTLSSLPIYEAVLLDTCPTPEQLARAKRAYELMLLTSLDAVLARSEQQPDYGFVDTKFSLMDGRNFASADPLRGKAAIYGWIQGRALEALAGHRAWLKRTTHISSQMRESFDARLGTLLTRLVRNLEKLRQGNHGRLSFVMTTDGQPLQIVDCRNVVRCAPQLDAPMNFTDLFYAKGLAAAAASVGDASALQAARQLFDQVAREIESGRFTSDQQQLDPGNPGVKSVSGRHPHSPRMIAIGATALFFQLTHDDVYSHMGMRFIEHVLRYFVNKDRQQPAVPAFCLWEYVDDKGQPYIEADGLLRSLPGHATEFVGLALKHLRVSGSKELHLQQLLAETLRANFHTGWAENGCGMVHSVDLISRRVLNTNMPWWSLPETIRAAMECRGFLSADQHKPFAQIAVTCSNAFVKHYVQRDVHCMSIQTLDKEGKAAPVIPAMPDADPCYHTGLSIIDALELLEANR